MANWLDDLRGIREVVDADDIAYPTRKRIRFLGGAVVTDDSDSETTDVDVGVQSLAEVSRGSMGSTETIDWSANPAHKGTLDSATCALSFTSPGGVAMRLVLKLTQDGTGGRAITHPASVKNVAAGSVGGVSLVTTANTTTVIAYYFDGTNYWAELICTGIA
jgi:hypothetical protein